MSRFQIGGYWYQTHIVRGRLFFNGEEQGIIVHHDRGVIDISDTLPLTQAAAMVAEAVSQCWMQSIEHGEWPPKMPGVADASFTGPSETLDRKQ